MPGNTVIVGDIVTQGEVLEDGFVVMSEGRIAQVGSGTPPSAGTQVDARGKWVLPGVIDGQTHTGSQANREGLGMGTRAAAAGGVTTIVDMPYDDPQPVVNVELFLEKVAAVRKEAHVDVALYATIAKENGVAELPAMIEAGACAVKLSTYESHPSRFPRIAATDMYETMKVLARSGLSCGIHNESQEIVDTLSARLKAAGRTDADAHGESRPPLAELLAIAEVYEIGAAAGCRIHIVHCSVDRGYTLCQSYKAQGVKASIETCMHYLVFDDSELRRQGAFAKVNPPLRDASQVEALWKRIALGHVDFVSSDHVAWSEDRKVNPDIFRNSSGMPGLEVLLPAFYTESQKRGLPIHAVPKLLSEGPARHFNLHPRKGGIFVGADADIAVLERGSFKYDPTGAQSAAKWSVYKGRTFAGRVSATFVRGQLAWDGVNVVNSPGDGVFVPALRNADAA
ncbi:MAG: amidohydrolase family protein [Pseudomonadota bacterium]